MRLGGGSQRRLTAEAHSGGSQRRLTLNSYAICGAPRAASRRMAHMNAWTKSSHPATPTASASRGRLEILLALAAFAVLCIVVLTVAPQLVEPDDYAYRASIVAMTQGHFLSLSAAQFHALSAQMASSLGGLRVRAAGPGGGTPGVAQWVRLADGRWISEKDPGYPFLAAPFQALGIIRLAPLFYGALEIGRAHV